MRKTSVCGLILATLLLTPSITLADTLNARFILFEAGSVISDKETIKDLQEHNKVIKTENLVFETNQKIKFEADNQYSVEIRVLKVKEDGSKLVNVDLVRTAAIDMKSKGDDSVDLHIPEGRFVNSERMVIKNNQVITFNLNERPALVEITKIK